MKNSDSLIIDLEDEDFHKLATIMKECGYKTIQECITSLIKNAHDRIRGRAV